MHEIMQEGITDTCDAIMGSVKDFNKVMLIVDERILVPEGLRLREVLYLVRRIRMLRNIYAAILLTENEKSKIFYEFLS
jgi:hypothetical protein